MRRSQRQDCREGYNVCARDPSRIQAASSAGPGPSRRQDHKQAGTESPWLSPR